MKRWISLIGVVLGMYSPALADTPPQFINKTCPTSQWFDSITPSGGAVCRQPTYSDIGGTIPSTISLTGQNYLSLSGTVLTANSVNLTNSNVTGILPVVVGGTNSSAALSNNRIMISNAGQIIEQSGLTAGRVLITDVNGLPVASSLTTTVLDYVDPTSSIQTQFNTLTASLGNYVLTSSKGQPNGVASLDSGGTVPISQIPSSIVGGLQYQGTWDASANSPTLTSSVGTKGYFYDVSVAGTTCLNTICSWSVQDFVLFNGSVWEKIPNASAVVSVNGQIGAVVLTTDQVSQGSTNLYMTNSGVLGQNLTGYVSITGAIDSSDTILSSIEKLNGNQSALITGVSLVFGRSGDVTAQSGDYNSDQVTQGSTNFYFSNALAQGAFSFIDSLTATAGTVKLVNDATSPGNSQYYGTNSSGVKGFYSISSGSVTSVALNDASTAPIYVITGSPVTGSGTLTFTLNSQSGNQAFLSPNGSSGQPSFRSILGADLPLPSSSSIGGVQSIASNPSNWIAYIDTSGVPHQTQPAFSNLSGSIAFSQFPAIASNNFIGNNTGSTGTPFALTSIQATAMLNLFSSSLQGLAPASGGGSTNFLRADGTWAAPTGSVSSVGLADGSTSPIFNITNSPVTSSGTLTETLKTQTANTVFSGPGSGSAAQPGFRSLVGADLPNPSSSTLGGIQSKAATTSQWINSISTSGVPSSTQPAFTDISGNTTLAQLPSISNNTALGNVSGSPATPVALTQTQLTTLMNTFTSSLSGAAPSSGGGSTNYLRADGTWTAPPGTVYTFSTGLTNVSSTITSNLSTGISGGQSVIGGISASNNLTLSSTSNSTKGQIISDSQLTWKSGLGAINQILGPTDQALNILAVTPSSVSGYGINITAGNAGSGSTNLAGGNIVISAGNGTTPSGNTSPGGTVTIQGGASATSGGGTGGAGGTVNILGGAGAGSAGPGAINITAGAGSALSGGPINITGGAGSSGTSGGNLVLSSGPSSGATSGSGSINGASVLITSSNGKPYSGVSGTAGSAGAITMTAGNGGVASGTTSIGGNGGSFNLLLGAAGTGTSTNGVPGNFNIQDSTATTHFSVASTGATTLTEPNLTTTVTAGVNLINPTAGTVSVTDQNSPAIILSANKWNTATSASVNSIVRQYMIGTDVNGGALGTFQMDYSDDGGATFANLLSYSRQNQTLNIGGTLGGTGGGNINANGLTAPTNSLRLVGLISGSSVPNGFGGGAISLSPNISNAAASGTFSNTSVLTSYSQTGTASGYDLVIQRTETTVGSGTQRLFSAGKSISSVYTEELGIDNNGNEIINPSSVTGSLTTSALLMTPTWNTTGVATALKVNVTNTASGVGSKLIDLQTGSTSVYSVSVTGAVAGQQAILATITGINAFSVANTALYTVPTGRTAIITNVVVRSTAASSVTSGPAVGVGNIAGTNNIFASATLSALTTTNSIFGFTLVGMSLSTPASGVVYLNLGTAATGTSETIAVDVMGYLL